jgi:prepilin-type N-terminal cleavage/methylation domain-containing protein
MYTTGFTKGKTTIMNTLSTRLQNRLHDRLRQSKDEKGFTLIELLIVIVILGILAGVVIFASGQFADSGKREACETTRQTVKTSAEAFRANGGIAAYPAAWADILPYFDLNGVTFVPPAGAALGNVRKGSAWNFTWTPGATTADAPTVGDCVIL